MTRVDEEYFVGSLARAFAFVEKPERAGQCDGVEELWTNGNHDIDRARLDQVLANLLLGTAHVAGRVGHDETGASTLVERTIEEVDPEIIAVIHAWLTQRKTARRQFRPVDTVDIKR